MLPENDPLYLGTSDDLLGPSSPPKPPPPNLLHLAPYVCFAVLGIFGCFVWSPASALITGTTAIAFLAVVDRRRNALAEHRKPEEEAPADLGEAFDPIAARLHFLRDEAQVLMGFFKTKNAALAAQVRRLERVVERGRAAVLILGPTGSGKTSLASALHECFKVAQKRAGAFVPVNCVELAGDLGASLLFGHVEGAFTGAGSVRGGLIRQAEGGTLFLDETGELSEVAQSRLVTVLDSMQFRPVGTDQLVSCDVRVIAATSRDLAKMVAEGKFRKDLYERLTMWPIVMPPLTARREDLDDALDAALAVASKDQNRTITMMGPARALWLRYCGAPTTRWEANFRTFNFCVGRMATMAPDDDIDLPTVEEEIALRSPGDAAEGDSVGALIDLVELIGELQLRDSCHIERVILREVIRICRRSASAADASRALFAREGVEKRTEHTRLRKYLATYGLTYEKVIAR